MIESNVGIYKISCAKGKNRKTVQKQTVIYLTLSIFAILKVMNLNLRIALRTSLHAELRIAEVCIILE